LHCDFVNLGFSGNAKGQPEMADYLASMDMKMLVYDYDHNAPDVEFLRNTHGKMFDRIREGHPDIPIIMMSTTPKLQYAGSNEERVGVILSTYQRALDRGDNNVYFVNGSKICDESDGHVGATVEGSHLNDIGFQCVANALEAIIKPLL
jgi:hypothetical protein